MSPAKVLTLGFASIILMGAVLLSLPFASADGQFTSFIDALFTATSAVCVTGLIVVDTAKYYSFWGKSVILFLIQIGGLGYMTLATLMFIFFNKKITIRDKLALREGTSRFSLDDIVGFVKYIVKITLFIEGLAALILTIHWSKQFPFKEALGHAIFHSVSAFCNAGFSTFSTNLSSFVTDPVVNFTIAFMIILGGLGFIVISELQSFRKGARLSVHTRMSVTITLLLLAIGTGLIFAFEYQNPDSLHSLSFGQKMLASFFQAVTPRTAGFNTLNLGLLRPISLFLMIILMFIGSSPGGTGGGIKTTTFGLIIMAIWAMLRGKVNVNVFGRKMTLEMIRKSMTLTLLSLILISLVTAGILMVNKNVDFLRILFEVFSAFGTVGLSAVSGTVSLSSYFPAVGKLLIIVLMYFGRVGPLTIGTALIESKEQELFNYAEEKVLIG